MKIRFNHVSFKYNKKENKVLDDVNLQFDNNEIVFLMGRTGSGKTTLVQHINGLLFASEGNVTITIDDTNYILDKDKKEKRLNDIRSKIGLVFLFPEYQLFETTVLKDVMFGPMNFYKDESKAREMAIEALHKVGLGKEFFDKSPFELSGGEKRKVAIAGVLASDPEVLIMDEPTSSLDPISSREVMELIKGLKEEGKMIIVISHDTDLCYEYADRVIVMVGGRCELDAKTKDFFEDKRFLESVSLKEPFICKVKRCMNINEDIRNIEQLKEVIRHG